MGGSLGRRHSGSVMELQPREEGWKWCGVAGWGEGWGREGERSTRGAGLGNEEHLIAREVASVAPQRENPGQHSGAGDASAREHGTQRLSSGPFSKQSGVGRWMTCMAKWPMLAICWPYAHVGHMATVLAGTTSGVAGHWPQGRCTHAPAAAAAVSLHHRPRRVLQQFVPAVAGSQGPKCMLGSFSGPHNPTPPYTTQHTHTHTHSFIVHLSPGLTCSCCTAQSPSRSRAEPGRRAQGAQLSAEPGRRAGPCWPGGKERQPRQGSGKGRGAHSM